VDEPVKNRPKERGIKPTDVINNIYTPSLIKKITNYRKLLYQSIITEFIFRQQTKLWFVKKSKE
jgi:hypothetical protein